MVDSNDQAGGFDYEFLDEVLDGQKCTICLLPMRDAVQTKCGHRFCSFCLKESLRTNSDICPTCRTSISGPNEFFCDLAMSRDILSLYVKCQLSSRGCDWKGEVREIADHKNLCSYVDESCTTCKSVYERRHAKTHLEDQCPQRTVECRFCKGQFPAFLKQLHEEKYCEQFPFVCPNQCGFTEIPRQEMEVHLTDHCSMTEVICPYKDEGCQFEDKRAFLLEHLQTAADSHIRLMWIKLSDGTKKQSSDLTSLTEKVSDLERRQQQLKDSAELKVLVQNLEKENKDLKVWVLNLEKNANNMQKEHNFLKVSIQRLDRKFEEELTRQRRITTWILTFFFFIFGIWLVKYLNI